MANVTLVAGRGQTSGPTVDWVNPGKITVDDNDHTYASLTYGSTLSEISDYIRADEFGFDIPEFAVIDGIWAKAEKKAGASNIIKDYAVNILKNGTVPSGSDDKKDTSYWLTSNGISVTYGGPIDLWGTTWTPADINNSLFGFALRAEYLPNYGSAIAYVDYMEMTIYYTLKGIKYGTTSVGRVYAGTTIVKAIYYGTTQIG